MLGHLQVMAKKAVRKKSGLKETKKLNKKLTKKSTATPARFTKKTIEFLREAGEATSPDWLDRHKKEHQEFLIQPLQALAFHIIEKLGGAPEGRGYKFPRRGFGRLRRPSHKVGRGEPAYRDFVHLQASRPSKSIFDENPNLYFFLSPDSIFSGAGMYEPSSRQVKKVRAWLADDPSEMFDLFKSKAFKREFPNGLEMDKVLKTFPRFYPQDHKRIQLLRLQAFYVKRDFSRKEFYSAEFADMLVENWRQALKLNELLYDVWNAREEGFIAPEAALEEEPDEDSGSNADLWDDRL